MSEPITLSDQLFVDAQAAAAVGERSAAAQIEYWARLGRSIDSLLHLPNAKSPSSNRLSDVLRAIPAAPGRERLAAYLAARPYPHYESAGDGTQEVIRIEADGTRTRGRFEGRTFQPVGSAATS